MYVSAGRAKGMFVSIHATAYWWPHAIVKIATHNDSTDLTNTHRLIKSQPYCTGTTHTEHGKCGKIHACIWYTYNIQTQTHTHPHIGPYVAYVLGWIRLKNKFICVCVCESFAFFFYLWPTTRFVLNLLSMVRMYQNFDCRNEQQQQSAHSSILVSNNRSDCRSSVIEVG